MSEIKGQLLGLVIVLGLFATVSGIVTALSTGIKSKIEDRAEDAELEVTITPSSRVKLLHY